MEIEYQHKHGMVERNLLRYLALLRQLSLDGTVIFDESGKIIVKDNIQRENEDSLNNPFLPQFLWDYNYRNLVN
jgi:hypothetical protein